MKKEMKVLLAGNGKNIVGRQVLLGETDSQKEERLELAVKNQFPPSELLSKLEIFGIKGDKSGKS